MSSSFSANSNHNYLKLPEIDTSQGHYPKKISKYYEESSSIIIKNDKIKSKTYTDKSISALSLNNKSKLNSLNDRASRLTMSDYIDLNENNIILNEKRAVKKNESTTINEIMKNKKIQLRDIDDKNYIEYLELQRIEKENKLITNDNSQINIANNDELNDSYALIKSERLERKLLNGLYAPKDASMSDIMKQLSKRADQKLLKKLEHRKDIESSSTMYA
jgi:hypothetical protein